MGVCVSCETTPLLTAKLILQDGRLEEFSYPIKVAYLTQRDPTTFICDSDEMDFDISVSPVAGEKELKMGQIYFSLPTEKLKRPLTAEEMAALAVRASSALMKCGYRTPTVIFSGEKAEENGGDRRRWRRRNGGSREFKVQLSAIPE